MEEQVVPKEICTPITYKNLERFCQDSTLPATAVNDKGENVIISTEPCTEGKCYRLDTYQNNNWIRINRYYQNGDVDETYDR